MSTQVCMVINDERKEFFYTEKHGMDVVDGVLISWTLTDKLPGPGTWVSVSFGIPHYVTPRKGVEDGFLHTREDAQALYYPGFKEVRVADLVDTTDVPALVKAISERMAKFHEEQNHYFEENSNG